MQAIVAILAVIGVAAILRGLARTVVRLGLSAAEESTASGLAQVSARRGDLTGMAERTEAAQQARRRRRRGLLVSALWAGWLVVPPFVGWAPQAYALAAPLWVLGRRGGGRGGGDGGGEG